MDDVVFAEIIGQAKTTRVWGALFGGGAALDHGCPIQIAKPWLDRDWSL